MTAQRWWPLLSAVGLALLVHVVRATTFWPSLFAGLALTILALDAWTCVRYQGTERHPRWSYALGVVFSCVVLVASLRHGAQ